MLKDSVRENNEEQKRRNGMSEAIGMCKMSGANPSEDFYMLIEEYINGEKTLDEIDAEFDDIYKKKVAGSIDAK